MTAQEVLLFHLRRGLVRLAPVFVEDVDHPQRNAVVVLCADLVGESESGVFVEHPIAEGPQRVLVT